VSRGDDLTMQTPVGEKSTRVLATVSYFSALGGTAAAEDVRAAGGRALELPTDVVAPARSPRSVGAVGLQSAGAVGTEMR
ncbi:hypothetical protein ACWELQ_31860, partial [Nocardia sp. NPDC004722]